LIKGYKLITEKANVNYTQFFQLTSNLHDLWKYFFSQRITNSWNELPCAVVKSSINQFKTRLNKYLKDTGH